jgi:hypothetical protein
MPLAHRTLLVVLAGGVLSAAPAAHAYPPGVGILTAHRDCLGCHAQSGTWSEGRHTIVDILDAETRRSLRSRDGRFVIEVPRGERKTVITLIGRAAGDPAPPAERHAWLFVAPSQIGTSSLSKFAPGWDVDLSMACRVVGDTAPEYPGARLTALPMTIRPGDAAGESELELQMMLVSGDGTKGSALQGLTTNYLVRRVRLRVIDPPVAAPARPAAPAPPPSPARATPSPREGALPNHPSPAREGH